VEAAPEPGDQLELIPKSTVEIGVPKEPAAIPESEPQSVLAQLFRLASSTGTLVGPAASPPPAVTKLIQQKPTPAMVEGTTESITAEVAQLSKFPVPHTVDVSVSPEATAAVSSASAPNAEIADAKIQPNESNQPPEPPEESLSSKVESAPPAAPADQQSAISIETPAQANHIFELIAAAVQRGALAGVQVSPQPESTPKEPAPTDLNAAAPVNSPPAASSQSPATPPASNAFAESAPSNVPKEPARIRITPRKIKPRPQVPAEAEPVAESPLFGSYCEKALASDEPPVPIPKKLPIQSVNAGSPPAPLKAEPVMPSSGAYELPVRKTTVAMRYERDAVLTARERRNRWIGYGLSEVFSLTSLGLLSWFGLTHHFPDPTLKLLMFILLFASAAIAVLLPVIFMRNNPHRWQRRD
jgi:hypothetical protein